MANSASYKHLRDKSRAPVNDCAFLSFFKPRRFALERSPCLSSGDRYERAPRTARMLVAAEPRGVARAKKPPLDMARALAAAHRPLADKALRAMSDPLM